MTGFSVKSQETNMTKKRRVSRPNRTYRDMKGKQKGRIAEKTYRSYLIFYLENNRMPDENEQKQIHQKLFRSVIAYAPKASYEEFEKLCLKRSLRYEERIAKDIENGVTMESLQKKKKTPEEKAAARKRRIEANRERRRLRKEREEMDSFMDQDENFFFIAGYTSGGAPYGITWEAMGLEPFQDEKLIEDIDLLDTLSDGYPWDEMELEQSEDDNDEIDLEKFEDLLNDDFDIF